jgi:hypothetical protein
MCHSEGFTTAGYAQEGLEFFAGVDSLHEPFYSFRLVACRGKRAVYFDKQPILR